MKMFQTNLNVCLQMNGKRGLVPSNFIEFIKSGSSSSYQSKRQTTSNSDIVSASKFQKENVVFRFSLLFYNVLPRSQTCLSSYTFIDDKMF